MTTTDHCMRCKTPLADDNTPSPFSVRLLRARKHGFDKPLCGDCLKKLDLAEMPPASDYAESLMQSVRNDLASYYARGVDRERLEEAVRLFAVRLAQNRASAFKEVHEIVAGVTAMDEEE
ncbi:hypothetical protein [Bradyrhizobium sp. Ai1a-2]|uniref:hypothetical protein n=1 Tax=Bradyrhizobium sp. Ai1a-2 TaxID=196490 RepID=UPI000421DC7E|nr:hypothetical protein [Bradyrhizobium sp. Ai1a-2]